MKILSIDTSSNICGVSILEDHNLICKLDQNTGRTHSENLMPMIEQAFIQSNLTLKDMDLLVCDRGPGSFTGIRIGIATIKAFHDSLGILCTGVSSLKSLAYAIKENGWIVSILDCQNNNCYFALYKLNDSQYIEMIPPTADTIQNALQICQKNLSIDEPITFVGDGSVSFKEQIQQKFEKNVIFASTEANALNSYCVGLAGLDLFKQDRLEDVLPLYLKKPQAQRQLEEKSKSIKIATMTQEDLKQISDILTSDFDDFWTYSILKEELSISTSSYLVAKLDNEIVGFAGVKFLLEEANIMNIVVKKSHRNQGIGSLLLNKLIQLSQEQHATSITLEVMEENYPAIHLYKNFGFELVGSRKNYYKNKSAIIMTKTIL